MTVLCSSPLLQQEQDQSLYRKVILSLPGIRCAGCIGSVERSLISMPGVQSARVNLSQRKVLIKTDRAIDDLVERLAEAGYEAHALNIAALENRNDTEGRALLLRLGVAGFAMMNVMLLSVAVWSGATAATRDLFHLISAAIAIPVVAYSGQPFFQSAMGALRGRRLNMDVPISLAILLAAGMSLYESLNSGAHAYFDAALSLTFFLLIGRYLDHRTKAAARSAAKDLSALESHRAQRLVGNTTEDVEITALTIGDIIQVPTGVRVPVDGTLLTGATTDRSFLTGESNSVQSKVGDTLRAGEVNLAAPLRLRATAVGEDTTLRRLATLVETAENARNRYTALADRAARVYAPAVHLLALAAFMGWWFIGGDLRQALNIAIAVLIITCPCALGLAVPAVSTAAIARLYKEGFLVKSGTALERLSETEQIVFDKTGTLTIPGVEINTDALDAQQVSVALALAQASAHPVSRALSCTLKGTPATVTDLREEQGVGMHASWGDVPVFLGAGKDGLCLRIGESETTIGQSQCLRPGVSTAVKDLREEYALSILSGDSHAAVDEVGNMLEISELHAEVTAEEKHEILSDMTHVTMIGDGLNDAASLAVAHASIAPSSALDATRNVADIVILRESFAELPLIFSTAKAASRLSRQNFAIATGYNLIAIPIALAGFATPLIAALAMSASSLTVVANAMRIGWTK